MVILNSVMTVISLAALWSLFRIRDFFRPVEVIVYLMVIIVAIEQIHSAIVDNFKLIEYPVSLPKFFFYKLNQLIVIPAATLWLLCSFYSPRLHFLVKALFALVWFSGMTGAFALFHRLGIFQFAGWNMMYSSIVWLTVLVESFLFSLWFRKLLRKRDDRDSVSARTV